MTRLPYQYVALRCVPRPEREEFVNVGVVLFCEEAKFLDVVWQVDAERLRALAPGVDVDAVCEAMRFIDAVCAGDESVGAAGAAPLGQRFGFLKAPRSTVIQPGPVHGGLTTEPAGELAKLRTRLVG